MAEEKTNVYNREALSKTTAFKKPVGSNDNSKEPAYYIEYKEDSAYHRHGESQLIKADEAFIGREAKCLIRFDTEHFPTVSREHAVIVREGENYKLIHMSQTNATLVNGTIINQSFYLQDGDEIQLSEGGPHIAFMLTEKAKAASNGTSGRKLRSYKLVTFILAAILAVCAGGYAAYKYFSGAARNIEKLSKDVYTVRMTEFTLQSDAINEGEPFSYSFDSYGDTTVPTATGFMTGSNQLVTSHHVVEPWYYRDCTQTKNFNEDPIAYVNLILTQFGGHVVAKFEAKSDDGKIIEFTSDECIFNPAEYQENTLSSRAGQFKGMKVKMATTPNDFAYVKRNVKSNIATDPSLWNTLSDGEDLYIVGAVMNVQNQDGTVTTFNNKIQCAVATLTGQDQVGNQIVLAHPVEVSLGSPVFCKKRGKYYCIGTLVSTQGNQSVIMPFNIQE